MERATLRPVPQRPAGPVEPAAALAHVQRTLPALDEAAREALALVDLVGRSRPQVSAEAGVAEDTLADALARARKALRRAAFPLPGSGWCERAERLLSDELDGSLPEPGPRRLAAHLANCDRCVEHERRLWQARDQLVATFEQSRSPEPDPEPQIADEPDPEPVEIPDPGPPVAPLAAPMPELRLVEPAAEVPAPAEPLPVEPEPADPEPAEPEPVEPEPVAAPDEPEPAALALTTGPGPLVNPEPARRSALGAFAWTASLTLAVLLALASLAITIYAVAGGNF
ncbi:MAG TPA: zf-HC2 domain-containing protein [Thermoleophilaceae bacterium]|nr:zf-HC2 domain-containing protein [Thermoleophilaceae bacterium]